MNRADIVAKMSLREKEIFEKYKDTYPFPLRKFIEEIEIKIIEEKSDKKVCKFLKNKEDGVHYIVVSGAPTKEDATIVLCLALIHFYFERDTIDMTWGAIAAAAFLMPTEIFLKKGHEFAKKSSFNCKKVAKYFGVPPGLVEFYIDHLMGVMNLNMELEKLVGELGLSCPESPDN